MLSFIILFSVALFADAKNEEYKGHKVYNIKFDTAEQALRLPELQSDVVDFWRRPSFKPNIVGQAMVPASHRDWFEEKLIDLGITRDIFTEDVYEHLAEFENSMSRSSRNDTEESEEIEERVFDFQSYYRYDEILTHMFALEERTANSSIKVTVEEYGRTEENRTIVYLKVSDTTTQAADKPVVIIESAIIPRDWITIPAALNIVNRLLEQTDFVQQADWIIVPVVNPDGYEFTHTDLRLWQKSRSTRSHLGFICPGVNINRNFDIDWSVSDSSSSPCSHLYAGIEAFSEVESQLIKDLVETYNSRIRLYISLQSGGGFVSYPWQFEKAATGMFRQHLVLGMQMVDAMNEDYLLDVGWSALGDRASGTGSDYVQMSGVLYSLNINVVPRGQNGVNVPENEIVTVIEDVWRAVSVAGRSLLF